MLPIFRYTNTVPRFTIVQNLLSILKLSEIVKAMINFEATKTFTNCTQAFIVVFGYKSVAIMRAIIFQ